MLDLSAKILIASSLAFLFAGCGSRNDQETNSYVPLAIIAYAPIYIFGSLIKIGLEQRERNPEYKISINVDDSRCNISTDEFRHIGDNIHIIKIGMKRQEIEVILGLDKIKKRMVVTAIGPDLDNLTYIYYLGRKSGIEMGFNDFSSDLIKAPKLIGAYWLNEQ